LAAHAGDLDDPAAALLAPMMITRAFLQPMREQEDLDLVADLFDGHFLGGAHNGVSGIVDHNVHRPGPESPADRLVDVGRACEVEDLDSQPVAVRLAQVFQSRGAADRRRDAVAIAEGVLGEMAAQATGGSGDEPVT
jgi:hypothetical protein